jgi:hypothetical protein
MSERGTEADLSLGDFSYQRYWGAVSEWGAIRTFAMTISSSRIGLTLANH